jgi:Undecaprenyl-phosphate galactose phosphotransferase WbaP
MLGKFDWWAQPLLIVGNARTAEQLFQRLIATRHEGLRPVGVVFDAWEHWDVARDTLDIPFIGPVVDLQSILFTTGATRLAVADHNQYSWHEIQRFRGIPHIMVPTNLWHHPIEKSRLAECDGRIELHCHSALTNPFALMAKRGMDLSLILLTLPVWLPILLLIALIIKVTDRGPAFYKQARVGRFRKPFYAIKFRSMVCNADERLREHLDSHPELQDEWNRTHKLQEDPRITRFGCFLRKTSLDELPQLVNVLSGDMSLVGPRPIIDSHDYDREYIHEHPEVFDMYQMVRPGVTGLWQISGRNLLPYKQRVSLDRFYLHNWSVSLDMYILWRTLKTALLREGAY